MQLYSAGVSGIFLALKSGCRVTISSGDASVALYTNLWLRKAFHHPACTDDTREPTAIASVLLMTMLMGCVYVLVGYYRAADLVQYLPFPIIAGFLGMVGASIVRGGLVVALGRNLESLPDLGSAVLSVPYEFGAALGLVIVLLVLRRVKVPTNILFMSTMAAALLLFYAPTTFLRIARSELRARGFLFPISEPVGPLDIWRRLDLSRVTWSALVPASGEVFGTLTILTISLVLRVSAIDSAAQVRDGLGALGMRCG
jgi:SulP family sulfate permease